ncbi:MAG: SOUL family heme-binding protein [Leucothrix sp.]
MKFTLLAVLLSLLLSGCGILGQRYGEEALYATMFSDGDYEIRLYEPLIVAQAASEGNYQRATLSGYQRLKDYMSGNNRAQQTVDLNPPGRVSNLGLTKTDTELTTPYFEELVEGVWLTSVAMPEAYTLATLPQPNDEFITFETLPRMKVAVIRFSGFRSQRLISNKADQLLQWMQQENLTPASAARSAVFDPPLTIPGLRRHEIHVSIQ